MKHKATEKSHQELSQRMRKLLGWDTFSKMNRCEAMKWVQWTNYRNTKKLVIKFLILSLTAVSNLTLTTDITLKHLHQVMKKLWGRHRGLFIQDLCHKIINMSPWLFEAKKKPHRLSFVAYHIIQLSCMIWLWKALSTVSYFCLLFIQLIFIRLLALLFQVTVNQFRIFICCLICFQWTVHNINILIQSIRRVLLIIWSLLSHKDERRC